MKKTQVIWGYNFFCTSESGDKKMDILTAFYDSFFIIIFLYPMHVETVFFTKSRAYGMYDKEYQVMARN